MGNQEYEEKKPPEETTDAQGTDTSIFGAVDTYRDSYEGILDQQDTYLQSAYQKGKDRAAQSYQQEQSAAYSDYQRQVDPYGAQAEQLASSGLSNSGYAESLKTQAYVAYQNRLAVARQSYESTLASFENSFNEAKMQNDAKRAELAFQTFQTQYEMIVSMILNDNGGVMQQAGELMKYAQGDPEKWLQVLGLISGSENGVSDYDINALTAAGTVYNDRDSAIEALKANGVTYKPMPEWQWNMGHNTASPSKDYRYDSYSEYLTAFVNQYI